MSVSCLPLAPDQIRDSINRKRQIPTSRLKLARTSQMSAAETTVYLAVSLFHLTVDVVHSC